MKNLAAVCLCLAFLLGYMKQLHAQNYLYATGSPTFSTQIPIENGFINVNNGDIHIEIPLATHPQRGRLQLNERLIYDSRIWKIVQNGGYSWQPTNVPNSMGGWVFSSGLEGGTVSYSNYGGQSQTPCDPADIAFGYYSYNQYDSWVWTDPQGTSHTFYNTPTIQYVNVGGPHCSTPPQGTPTASGTASDGSGYYIQITNYTNVTIYDSQGNAYNPTIVGVTIPQPSNSPGNRF